MLEFDPDGDGVVSPWEFKQALRNANVDIPDQQLNAIMRTMDLQVGGGCRVDGNGWRVEAGGWRIEGGAWG